MSALAEFYPCTWCAKDFQENLQKSPVATESREELCTWLCKQHNLVNQKLGKPLFDCQMENLDERWRKSSNPKCQSDH
jgi:FAD-linked sulfhydryl oxidase